ncbi:MAG TPA: segregation/condensation protein A, partial [Patescibacteria group bacterium]|nr:segregation/condensation protein A [Patescibacteria group bacterium]
LLLQLVEAEKLEITNVSLMQVTEPFVAHVREHQGKIPPEELADFLVVAAKLVYLKSRALLPSLSDPSLEEGPDLETQLRMYKAFVAAADRLGEMTKHGICSFGRAHRSRAEGSVGFVPPAGVTADLLRDLYQKVIRRLEPFMQLPKAAVERAISIEEKIEQLRERVSRTMKTSFHRFLAEASDRSEMVVSFLALLELIKQRIVKVNQHELFHDIHLERV